MTRCDIPARASPGFSKVQIRNQKSGIRGKRRKGKGQGKMLSPPRHPRACCIFKPIKLPMYQTLIIPFNLLLLLHVSLEFVFITYLILWSVCTYLIVLLSIESKTASAFFSLRRRFVSCYILQTEIKRFKTADNESTLIASVIA